MSSASKIEWTESTWNPIVGCSIVSPGCTHCYAMAMADRLASMAPRPDGTGNPHLLHYVKTVTRDPTNRGYDWSAAVWTGKVALAPERTLLEPLKRKKPTTYFVNSMGDLFHESVPDAWIDRVFAAMALTPRHTYQVLTKRAERMRDYCSDPLRRNAIELGAEALQPSIGKPWSPKHCFRWPLPNVWLGVSTERQPEYDERKDHLRNTPAAVRFFSMEPLLGPIVADYLGDWVIAGGESGKNARPMHPQWARSLRDQCKAAGVPFFFKQWGAWKPCEHGGAHASSEHIFDDGTAMLPVGKQAAGRLLDGREHNAMPGRL